MEFAALLIPKHVFCNITSNSPIKQVKPLASEDTTSTKSMK
jgi:hypothetical protein